MLFLTRKYRPLLGLDITTSSVKLIELVMSGGTYRVESYAAEPTPQNAMNEKSHRRRGSGRRGNPSGGSSALALVPRRLPLPFPATPQSPRSYRCPARCASVISNHKSRCRPTSTFRFRWDEVSYDFEVLGPSEKDPDTNDVLLVATRTGKRRTAPGRGQCRGTHGQDRRRRSVRARERLQTHDASDARWRHRSHHRRGRLRREQHHVQCAAQSQGRLHARLRLWWPAAHRRNHAHLRPVHGRGRAREEGRWLAGQFPGGSARTLSSTT